MLSRPNKTLYKVFVSNQQSFLFFSVLPLLICLRVSMTYNKKRNFNQTRTICVVYSPVKLRTNEAENLGTASLNPKFMVLLKKVYSEGSWLHNARYHGFVKRMGIRSNSFERMRLRIELAWRLTVFYYCIMLLEEFKAPQTILQVSCLMTLAQCVVHVHLPKVV